jgi:hypothetical protein
MMIARPLTIAEIFDRTVTLAVKRWQPVVVLTMLSGIPDLVLRATSRGHAPADGSFFWAIVLGSLAGAVAYPGIIHAFADRDEPRSIRQLLGRAIPDFWRSMWTFMAIAAVILAPSAAVIFLVGAAFRAGQLPGAIVAGTILGIPALLVVPFTYTLLSIVYPTLILERTGAMRSFRNAWSRAGRGGYVRTSLLGAAMLAAIFAPGIGIDFVVDRSGTTLGELWWLTLLLTPVSELIGTGFGIGLATVAAIDYRLRAEGTDLHAALEMPEPA